MKPFNEIAEQAVVLNQQNENIAYDAVLVVGMNPVAIGESTRGLIYFDKAERFDDETPVTTSTVQDVRHVRQGLYEVKTRNTTYLVAVA